jgi:hypothetical protein
VEGSVVQLTLTEKDAATLRKVLETYVSDLRMEIRDTDAHDFRDGLKQEEVAINVLIEQLRTQAHDLTG